MLSYYTVLCSADSTQNKLKTLLLDKSTKPEFQSTVYLVDLWCNNCQVLTGRKPELSRLRFLCLNQL